MKKIYFSLMTIAALLFTACNNDEGPGIDVKTGTLETTVIFEGGLNDEIPDLKAAGSSAIPITTWSNIKQVQLFLYDAVTGAVAYSDIIPGADIVASTTKTFSWLSVPVGSYRLALVANVNSNSDNVTTWVDEHKQPFDGFNVQTTSFKTSFTTPNSGTGNQIDLKEVSLPTSVTFPHDWGTGLKGYAQPAEIFTAYSLTTVNISEGNTTVIAAPLALKREISLLRARLNINEIPAQATPITATYHFDNSASNFIAVRRLPVGFGLNVGTFAGGVFNESDNNRVLVASSGTGTFKSVDPTVIDGYKSGGTIIDADYTLWHDIRVLPNASAAQIPTLDTDVDGNIKAPSDRAYFIIVSAWVDAGYVYADNSVATTNQPVYWSGIINAVFTKNKIREVNMLLKSKGYAEIPDPEEVGGLTITIGQPEEWHNVIEVSNIEG